MATRPEDYTVGWICAISIEFVVACELFDEEFEKYKEPIVSSQRDSNSYKFGRMHEHNVVIACLPQGQYGTTPAAIVAERMLSSFSNIRIGLMVGIAGGAPSDKRDIRLGDIVVSSPTPRYSGVIQYDFGKATDNHTFEETSYSAAPPDILLCALSKIDAHHKRNGNGIAEAVANMLSRNERLQAQYSRPAAESDKLFKALPDGSEQLVTRQKRHSDGDDPVVHYGLIASGNQLMKNRKARDTLSSKHDVLCFEMEAAGLMNNFPCVAIRGICDYSDVHKNDDWQGYAAATAAVYAKELLGNIPARKIDSMQTIEEASKHSESRGFKIPFSREGLPIAKAFIGRPTEIQTLKDKLLPNDQNNLRRLFVLHGLGGIGKTQLAVEFIRKCHAKFSAAFWLDGSNEDSLRRSILRLASRIPPNQISEQSRDYRTTEERDVETVIEEVMGWLNHPDNSKWLIVFDNVDREYTASNPDPLSYDIKKYMPAADHGSILITTRLTQLEKLGAAQEVKKVDNGTAKKILESRCSISSDEIGARTLLERLDGHPLAIAQAGSYLYQTGIGIRRYLQLYDKQPQRMAEALHGSDALLDDYPDRSVWTTWNISYDAVLEKNKYAANLLILWSFLDRSDLWYGLFEEAYSGGLSRQACLSILNNIAVNELSFNKAMTLLRSYSLVEGSECFEGSEDSRASEGYTMHTVVHHWVYFRHGMNHLPDFGVMALKLIGYAVPKSDTHNYARLQRRLLTHANMCWTKIMSVRDAVLHQNRNSTSFEAQITHEETDDDYLIAMNMLGGLFADQSKRNEAEKVFEQALKGCEKARRANQTLMLTITNNLGDLYFHQLRLSEAEKMYRQVPQEYEEALGTNHVLILTALSHLGMIYVAKGKFGEAETVLLQVLEGRGKSLGPKHRSTIAAADNLGELYRIQGKFDKAEEMFMRASREYEEVLEAKHISTFTTFNNLGNLYRNLGRFSEAENMCRQALQGYEEVLGSKHLSTLAIVNNLGNIYADQGKHIEAEKLYIQSIQGKEDLARGSKNAFVFAAVGDLGNLYAEQGRLDEAGKKYMRALPGLEEVAGTKHLLTLATYNNISNFYCKQGKFSEAEEKCRQALQGYKEIHGTKHISTLAAINNLGIIYANQGKFSEAEEMFIRVLQGYKEVLGAENISTRTVVKNICLLYWRQDKLGEAKMDMRVLQRYEEALSAELVKPHFLALNATRHLGDLCSETQASVFRATYEKVLSGYTIVHGFFSGACLHLKHYLGILESPSTEDDTNLELDTKSIGYDLPSRDKSQR